MNVTFKHLLIAGIPLYLVLIMVIGYPAPDFYLPNMIEEAAELMWQATYPLLIIAAVVPADTLINIGVLRCREDWDGWCSITPLGLFALAFTLSVIIYIVLVRIENKRKKAVP